MIIKELSLDEIAEELKDDFSREAVEIIKWTLDDVYYQYFTTDQIREDFQEFETVDSFFNLFEFEYYGLCKKRARAKAEDGELLEYLAKRRVSGQFVTRSGKSESLLVDLTEAMIAD